MNSTILKTVLVASAIAAIAVPVGSYLKDGGLFHGLAISCSLVATALTAIEIRKRL
jgi:hypothetical protein